MIVCVCHRVSEGDIARAVHQGCANFDDLQLRLEISSTCGRCDDCVREVFDRHAVPQGETVPKACCGGRA